MTDTKAHESTFRLKSYRLVKRFVGELTAAASASYVALRHTIEEVEKAEERDGWSILERTK